MEFKHRCSRAGAALYNHVLPPYRYIRTRLRSFYPLVCCKYAEPLNASPLNSQFAPYLFAPAHACNGRLHPALCKASLLHSRNLRYNFQLPFGVETAPGMSAKINTTISVPKGSCSCAKFWLWGYYLYCRPSCYFPYKKSPLHVARATIKIDAVPPCFTACAASKRCYGRARGRPTYRKPCSKTMFSRSCACPLSPDRAL